MDRNESSESKINHSLRHIYLSVQNVFFLGRFTSSLNKRQEKYTFEELIQIEMKLFHKHICQPIDSPHMLFAFIKCL